MQQKYIIKMTFEYVRCAKLRKVNERKFLEIRV